MVALGNNQLTDISWKALCSSSQGLRRLHAAECPRTTDDSLRSVATLKNLQYLDISLCNRCVPLWQLKTWIPCLFIKLFDMLCFRVSDVGIQYLTEGFSANKLQELNISQCSRITDISVMRIAQRYLVRLQRHTVNPL